MNKIKVKKTQLLTALKENLAKHIAEFNEADEQYRKEFVALMRDKVAAVEKGEKPDHTIKLVVPRSYENDYKTAIAALEFSVDDQVELTLQDIQCYVQDDWEWKNAFKASNSYYTGKGV